ncbi:hypothetical protein [Sphingobium sp. Z007]|uniref:hypothetical protein n=1 Tax=Sphingobium sp. Z007 TaxID=627495 RepID=UPI000B4970F1|nr:hypothetical protein [Sphingobium sp. Z007]
MGVTKTNAYDGPFYPNGIATSFPFSFRAMSATEVQLIAPDGQPLTGFNFTIIPAENTEGGSVVFGTPPTATQLPEFLIVSVPAFGVGIDLGSVTAFNPRTLNPSFDRLAVQNIYLQDQIDRTPRAPIGGGSVVGLFPRVAADGSWTFVDGTGSQGGAFSQAFTAEAGQTEYKLPFDLQIIPTVTVNGSRLSRGGYTYFGNTVVLGIGRLEGDIVEISVGNAVAEQILDIVGPFAFRDLSPNGRPIPAPGIYFGQGGASLSFETMISSNTGTAETDNQRGLLLLVNETADDGNSEEQTLCLMTRVRTGYAALWAPNTAYALGDNVQFSFPVNAVYRCIKAGTSAVSGPGPSGTGLNISDGGCRWMWINAQAILAKVGIYNEIVADPGGGNAWAQANNFELHAGYKASFATNTELDLTNNSGSDSVFGGVNRYNLYMITDGVSRSTAALEMTSRNIANYAAFWAIHITGDKHAENSVIGIDASSVYGIGFGASAGGAFTPTFTGATIKDGANALSSYEAAGVYGSQAISVSGTAPAAISLSGTFSGWLIYSPQFEIDCFGNVKAKSIAFTDLPPAYADDAAANAGGVAVGSIYRTGSTLKIRTA